MVPLDHSIKLFKGFNGVWLKCEKRTVMLELEWISVCLGLLFCLGLKMWECSSKTERVHDLNQG